MIIPRITFWIAILLGGALLGIYLDARLFAGYLHDVYFHILTLPMGLVLLYAVMLVSRNTGRILAHMGRVGDLPRMETNRLVTTGVYSCMRHPMHLGLMFFPLSLALILGSASFIMIIAPAEMLLILVMIRFVEEPEAIRKFGDSYIEYMRHVPAFNLKPSCLAMLFKVDAQ